MEYIQNSRFGTQHPISIATFSNVYFNRAALRATSSFNGIGNRGGVSPGRASLLIAGYLSTGLLAFSIARIMPDDLKDAISENAKGPAKAAGDAGSVEQHKLSEQIAADKYLTSKEAVKSKRRGLQFNKLVPPGAS